MAKSFDVGNEIYNYILKLTTFKWKQYHDISERAMENLACITVYSIQRYNFLCGISYVSMTSSFLEYLFTLYSMTIQFHDDFQQIPGKRD